MTNDKFGIEEIHKIREENHDRQKIMSNEEKINDTKRQAEDIKKKIKEIKERSSTDIEIWRNENDREHPIYDENILRVKNWEVENGV